jgi:hypothetical protein
MALAFLPFINSINNPRVAILHGVDILRLLAAGMLLGAGLVIIIIPRDRQKELEWWCGRRGSNSQGLLSRWAGVHQIPSLERLPIFATTA